MKIGEIIAGRYELREQIGDGRCSLYIAQDRQANRRVAIRIFDTAHVPPEALQRYANVLSAAASLEHPAVVLPRIQVATFETPPFVVGEVLEGENLGSVCGRLKTLPWERAVGITLACLEGLVALGGVTGLAHRALRPGNVWLSSNGQTQVLDFGIAEFGAFPTRPRSDGSHVEYCAPEQLGGGGGDVRSDIFSLGVMLFEMLTGVHPFSGPNAAAVRIKIQMHAAPQLSQVAQRVQLPTALESLVGHMLARRAKDRPSDYATLIRELARLLPSPLETPEQPSLAAPSENHPSAIPPRTFAPAPLPATDSKPKNTAQRAPAVELLRKSRVEQEHGPAYKQESVPDRTLILPEDRTEPDRPVKLADRTLILPTDGEDEEPRPLVRHPELQELTTISPQEQRKPRAPSRSLDRTLALPSNNNQDAEDQITLMRKNTHRHLSDRTEVLAGSKAQVSVQPDEQISSIDKTEAVFRSAPSGDASEDITEFRSPANQRPTAAKSTPRSNQGTLDDEVTALRPRQPLGHMHTARDGLSARDEADAPQSPDPHAFSLASEQIIKQDSRTTNLTAIKLIAINIILIILLIGLWAMAR